MRAEVTLLSRVIFGIDKDRIVRAGGHAGLAADADRLVEIDDAVCALEHCRGRTGSDTRRVRALIAARHLMSAARLWKDADVDMLHIRPRHRQRDQVLGLAGGGAGMTTNAARLVDNLGPLHRAVLWCFEHESPVLRI